MKALLIDAFDSFIYIIRQYMEELDVETHVVRNQALDIDKELTKGYDFIVLGPGPGHPRDARYVELIEANKKDIPILGVCLGHQAIGLAFGGKVNKATHLMHGKTSLVEHDGKGCFSDRASPLKVTRYHSLIVEKDTCRPELAVTAHSLDDGYIMGLRHVTRPIESVQFHPESICTEQGIDIFKNFVKTYC
jgi:anthranilate synthase component 2